MRVLFIVTQSDYLRGVAGACGDTPHAGDAAGAVPVQSAASGDEWRDVAERSSGVRDALDGLRRRWYLALLVAVPLFAGVVWYAERLPDLYDGEAVVAFSPRPDVTVSADTLRIVVPKYVAYLTSRATARSIAQEFGLGEAAAHSAIDAAVTPDTANLTISVRLEDPQVAAEAANALAREAVAFSTIDLQLQGRVVAPALPADAPASPPRRLLEAGGLLLALLAGATVAVIADRSRPRISSPLDLALLSGYGVLGRIPQAKTLRAGPADALLDPAAGTALRALRTSVDQQAGSPLRSLAVTSAVGGEGKTTVASSLAAAYARLDRRVLLVDGDLHRPRLGEHFGLPDGTRGLIEVLTGEANLSKAARSGGVPGLSVLTTAAHPQAGDLLTKGFAAMLERAQQSYDLVVVDCPPLLATADARNIALTCDAAVLVVATGTESGRVAEAAASLDALKVRVLGAVLNRSRVSRQGMGSYGAYA